MTVTLDYAPPNDAALLVFIDGVRQDTSAYGCTGTSLTFTGSVPSGTNNVQVVHMGLTLDVGVPGDGTVTQAKLGLGEGEYYFNPNTISSNLTTTVAATDSGAMFGPITVSSGKTWTISGTLRII